MQDRKKTLKKQLNANYSEQELIIKKVKDIVNFEIEEMPQTIIDARKQYLMLSQSDNTELISAINGENAILMTQVYSQKRDLSG